MEFYGRQTQQRRLLACLRRSSIQIALIYGRRRVGKSELIKHCLRQLPTRQIYYECKQTTEQNNTESLSTLISELFGLPPLGFDSMEAVLEYLFTKAQEEPLVLVLDEYPYLRETSQGIDSVLQSLIDRYRETSQLKLVLCGSYVEIMKSLLAKENPLYGRVDLSMDLKPVDYYDSALF